MSLRTLFCLLQKKRDQIPTNSTCAKETSSRAYALSNRKEDGTSKQLQKVKTSLGYSLCINISIKAIYCQVIIKPLHLSEFWVKCETIHNHCLDMMKICHSFKRALLTNCLFDIQCWMHVLIA